MSYNREIVSIQNDIQTAWHGIRKSITKMHPSSQIRPANATDVFRPDGAAGEAKFNVGPVVFSVPERASRAGSNLYIAISGWLSFGVPVAPDPRRTTLRFGTRVGYFRIKGDEFAHIYGVHFDIDERLAGHPVFHAQIGSQMELAQSVVELFNLSPQSQVDLPAGLLRNVRTPTAQMDVFSVITQVGADHLVSEASNPTVLQGFAELRAACDFFLGAAGRLAYLNSGPATHCYRSTHWYVREQTEVA